MIVGAGSSGLMMAAQLLRQGVYPVIIDQKLGLEKLENPVMIHARNLEMLRQMGMQEDFMVGGRAHRKVEIEGHKPLDFEEIKSEKTPFPLMLNMTEGRINRLLTDRLTSQACSIHWGVKFESLIEYDDSVLVEVSLTGREGEHKDCKEVWRADWVIAADGSESGVRIALDISTDHLHASHSFCRLDLALIARNEDNLPGSRSQYPIRLLQPKPRLSLVLPSEGKNRIHLLRQLSYQDARAFEQDQVAILNNMSQPLVVEEQVEHQLLSGALYTIQTSIAARFSSRRCFLIGSAAHQHISLMGKGVNEGFLDSWNLGWKLAGVVNGRMGRSVLFSYHKERHSRARFQAATSGRWQHLVLSMLSRTPRFAAKVLPYLLNYFLKKSEWASETFSRLSGIDISYRSSPLSLHYSLSESIKAGDRLPYHELFDEKTKTMTDTHKWCEKPGFTLIVAGQVSHHQLHVLGQWIKQKYPQGVHLFYLPYSQRNKKIFDRFGMGEEAQQLILVRPDMHIAYMTSALNTALIDNYLSKTMDWKLYRQFE